jgi:hypothetical protein
MSPFIRLDNLPYFRHTCHVLFLYMFIASLRLTVSPAAIATMLRVPSGCAQVRIVMSPTDFAKHVVQRKDGELVIDFLAKGNLRRTAERLHFSLLNRKPLTRLFCTLCSEHYVLERKELVCWIDKKSVQIEHVVLSNVIVAKRCMRIEVCKPLCKSSRKQESNKPRDSDYFL